jgi:hypothetical protein
MHKCFLLLFLYAGKISDFSNADVAVDQYHRFEVSTALFSRSTAYICSCYLLVAGLV